MANRFDYVKYDKGSIDAQEHFKDLFTGLTNAVSDNLVAGRAQSLVFTKLEEAYMWVGKAIRDEQIARNGSAPLQEERASS